MGCDGGTIPKRDELVRKKKKPEKVSKEVDLEVKWRHCAISQEPLRAPIVACELGRLFNKESVIEFLLDKSNPDVANKCQNIKGLKDVKELNLTENPAYSAAMETTRAGEDRKMSQYICPITGLELNGRFRFCYLLGCGCVLAERALNQIKDDSCITCGKSRLPDDVIIINGTDEDRQTLRTKMEQRRLLAKETRKSKKRTQAEGSACVAAAAAADAAAGSKSDASPDDGAVPCTKKAKVSDDNSKTETPTGTATASSTQTHDKGSHAKKADSVRATEGSLDDGSRKKYKSIQDNPNASDAYKSLFSSHETAKRQPKAHWITHNPLYY